jgi:hypothetical protein
LWMSAPQVLSRFLAGHALPYGLLSSLIEHAAEEGWAPLARPLLEVCQWLMLECRRGGGGAGVGPGAEAAAEGLERGAGMLERLFELHAALRDQILNCLLACCLPERRCEDQGEGEPGGQEGLVRAATRVLNRLAERRPQLLLPYAGGYSS